MTFAQDGTNSAALANEWNLKKRFSTMSFDPNDGTLAISYDFSTLGGLNKANFADVVDWWQTMMGEANKFFKEHPAPK
nr:YbjN domain-containing protein [Novosphingobium sp. Gsoil 351]